MIDMREDMEWKVFYEDFNGKEIEQYNVFDHYSFMEDIKDAYKKYKHDFGAFSEEVRRSLQYYFWSKCEWEVIISAWPERAGVESKIDVYDQITMNWDKFIKYTWDMCHARKNSKGDGFGFK